MEVHCALSREAEVKRFCTLLRMERSADSGLGICQIDRKLSDGGNEVRGMGNLNCAGTVTADCEFDLLILVEREILEARYSTVAHIGNVLVTVFHSILAGLGEERMDSLIELHIVPDYTVPAPQVTGNAGFVHSSALQRAAVQAAAGNFGLFEYARGRML